MIEITEGFTSISAGDDSLEVLGPSPASPRSRGARRLPTGARVTVEFRRTSPLLPTQAVTVRYDFAGNGQVREFTGIPKSIRSIVAAGRAVYDYRLSHWIHAPALMITTGARPRTRADPAGAPLRAVAGATSADPSPA